MIGLSSIECIEINDLDTEIYNASIGSLCMNFGMTFQEAALTIEKFTNELTLSKAELKNLGETIVSISKDFKGIKESSSVNPNERMYNKRRFR